MSKQIQLTKGFCCVVDDDDYEWLIQWKWQAGILKNKVYARRSVRSEGKIKQLLMHIAIAEKHQLRQGRKQVDHKNGDSLDNRKDNLRPATNQENSRNRKITASSGYKGVWQRTDTGKWRARIKIDGKFIVLGQAFPTAEDAARAYNEAAVERFGEFAVLNSIPNDGHYV